MSTNITSKGQVTVPKPIREALGLEPGIAIDFSVNEMGEVVLSRAAKRRGKASHDRFDSARGRADIHWRTDDLMALLRDGNG